MDPSSPGCRAITLGSKNEPSAHNARFWVVPVQQSLEVKWACCLAQTGDVCNKLCPLGVVLQRASS
eukprot:3071153-Prorocentrum_lima.AAC.1